MRDSVNAFWQRREYFGQQREVSVENMKHIMERVPVLWLIREMLNSLNQVTGTNSGHLL